MYDIVALLAFVYICNRTGTDSHTAFNCSVGIIAEDSNVFLIRGQRSRPTSRADDDSTFRISHFTVIAKYLCTLRFRQFIIRAKDGYICRLFYFIAVTDNSCCTATIGVFDRSTHSFRQSIGASDAIFCFDC